jgi:hypothetical protein
MTTKQRILNGESFSFPDAYYAHDKEIKNWFTVELATEDKYDQKIGQPIWLREEDRYSSIFYSIKSLGAKHLKVYTHFFKRRMSLKIDLDTVTFQSDYKPSK